MSPSGPRKLFKGVTTAMSGVLARFPLLLPVRNSFASYGASTVARIQDRSEPGGDLVHDLRYSESRSPGVYIDSPGLHRQVALFGPASNAQKRPKNAPKRPKTPQNAPKTPQKRPTTPQKRPFFDLKTPVFFSSVQVQVSFSQRTLFVH